MITRVNLFRWGGNHPNKHFIGSESPFSHAKREVSMGITRSHPLAGVDDAILADVTAGKDLGFEDLCVAFPIRPRPTQALSIQFLSRSSLISFVHRWLSIDIKSA